MGGRHRFVEWARAAGHPLDGVDLDLDSADLSPLAEIAGTARLVGLGDTWHPVHEFLAVNFRLTRFLVERMGFTGVLMEGSLATARQLDEFVNGGAADASTLVLSSLWDNDETISFLEWMRGHNASVPSERRVHVMGLDTNVLIMEDAYAPGTAVEHVVGYLERVDPGWAPPYMKTAREVFAGFAVGAASIPDRRRRNFEYFGTLDAATKDRLRDTLAALVARLDGNRAEYCRRRPEEDFEWALHRAVVLQQAQDMYEAHLRSVTDGIAVRALAMADNARWALDHLGGQARAVVLATTVHLARAPWSYARTDAELPSMGVRLAEWYGQDYVALSTTFGNGVFDPPNPVTGTTEIPAGAPDCVDLALADSGGSVSLVDLRGATAPSEWLAVPRPLRPMQNVASPPRYLLPDALDAVIHIDEIHSARPRRRAT